MKTKGAIVIRTNIFNKKFISLSPTEFQTLNPSPLLGMAFIPIEIAIIILKKSCQFILTNPVNDNLLIIVG